MNPLDRYNRDSSRAYGDDAFTSDRVYRCALPVKLAVEMMQDERGHHFDPELLDAFFLALPEVEATRRAYAA
jgi:HD-GYP domain-containing protein (c-di-GMP phosphodiesterase class II)